jgi:hypothetical protein
MSREPAASAAVGHRPSHPRPCDTVFAGEAGGEWLGGPDWSRGHQAILDGGDSIGGPPAVYARLGNRDVGRGEAVRDGWLRFQLKDADYRSLARDDVHAICTVDRQVGHILAVRFIG